MDLRFLWFGKSARPDHEQARTGVSNDAARSQKTTVRKPASAGRPSLDERRSVAEQATLKNRFRERDGSRWSVIKNQGSRCPLALWCREHLEEREEMELKLRRVELHLRFRGRRRAVDRLAALPHPIRRRTLFRRLLVRVTACMLRLLLRCRLHQPKRAMIRGDEPRDHHQRHRQKACWRMEAKEFHKTGKGVTAALGFKSFFHGSILSPRSTVRVRGSVARRRSRG